MDVLLVTSVVVALADPQRRRLDGRRVLTHVGAQDEVSGRLVPEHLRRVDMFLGRDGLGVIRAGARQRRVHPTGSDDAGRQYAPQHSPHPSHGHPPPLVIMDLNTIGWVIHRPLPRGAHAHESCSVGTHAAQQDGPAGEFLVCIPSGGQEACPCTPTESTALLGQLHSGIRADPLAWS